MHGFRPLCVSAPMQPTSGPAHSQTSPVVHDRFLGLMDTRIVYVESIARVASLSLSGRILYHVRAAAAFYVQWPALRARHPRSAYAGRLY